MGGQNLENLDDEELLSLFDATEKLLYSGMEKQDSPIRNKIDSIKKKLSSIEQELRSRSLWEGD